MHYVHCDITQFTLTYSIISMFSAPIDRTSPPSSVIAFYDIERPVHVILSSRIVYHRLKTSQIIHLLVGGGVGGEKGIR